MKGFEVLRVVDCLKQAGIPIWLDGGWGVDALVGRQTRPHSDLDSVVELDRADDVIECLEPLGFRMTLDDRPTRFVVADGAGRHIDFHPVVFDAAGNGTQIGAGAGGGDAFYPADGFVGRGIVDGREVACLTPKLLVMHHTGYEPLDKDRHNVRLLCEKFGLSVPTSYLEGSRDETGD